MGVSSVDLGCVVSLYCHCLLDCCNPGEENHYRRGHAGAGQEGAGGRGNTQVSGYKGL